MVLSLLDNGWLHDTVWVHNTTLSLICAGGGAILGYLLVRAVLSLVRRRLHARYERKPTPALDSLVAMVSAIRNWLLIPIAFLIAADFLHFSDRTEYWLGVGTFALVGIQLVLCINRVIVAWLRRSTSKDGVPGDVPVMLGILTWTVQFAVWITFLLALLTNAGVNITALVASLGIGGIAIALALQNILGDLFASIAIGLDKPFEVGEFIAFGSDMGTVTHVGIKTTRIESLSGEQLAIANSKLLTNLIHNYDRLAERRIAFGFRLPYGTRREQVQRVVERVNAIIEQTEPTRFDRGPFIGFGDYGLDFEFVYYVLDPSFTTYRDVQQQINVKIMDELAAMGVEFAVPARTVQLAGQDGHPS
jgi:small-conductance mechanosensitive channel